MWLKGFAVLFLLNAAAATPAKLLRVPKIYNALITSKEKILPSEAYPATTGPIFQPLGLAGEPILLPQELLVGKPKPLEIVDGTEVKLPEGSLRSPKPPAPVTFYPRYSLYYPHQPYLTLQQSLLYSQLFDVPSQSQLNAQHMIPRELEVAEKKDLTLQTTRMQSKMAHMNTPGVEYVKNNRPADRNIPDIPPPPPPDLMDLLRNKNAFKPIGVSCSYISNIEVSGKKLGHSQPSFSLDWINSVK